MSRDRTREPRPSVVVFDVNETLSDMSPMARRFEEVGAPGLLARAWFAGVLRDGFALTAVGVAEPFRTVATEGLRAVLGEVAAVEDPDGAVDHVMAGLTTLDVHGDVAEGVRALRREGLRLVTLSNGAAEIAEGLLGRAGLREDFEHVLSVEQAGVWKPAAAAYHHATATCAVAPADALLVAVHPWDIDGAARAGLRTAWLARSGGSYPRHFTPPDLTVPALPRLAELLSG